MAYIGRSTDGFGVRDRFVYVVSGGATSVSGVDANGAVLKFSDGKYVDVYLNGVLLKPTTDYNTNTANTISGISSMAASDEVTVIVYDIFAVADTVSATQGGTFSGDVSLPDNVKVKLGTGNDTEFFFDGTHTVINHTDASTGILKLNTRRLDVKSTDSSAKLIKALAGGAVTLFYDDEERIKTVTGGVEVTGTTDTDKLTVSGTGADYIASFQNTTTGTPYGVSIKEPSSAGAGYPLLNIANHDGSATRFRVDSSTGHVGIGAPPVAGDTVHIKDTAPSIMLEETSSGGSKRIAMAVSASGTPMLSAAQSGGLIDVYLTGVHTHRFYNSGFVIQNEDSSAALDIKANYTSGVGTPQINMFRSNVYQCGINAGVNSSATGGGNHVVIHAIQGEVYAKDTSGNVTLLSPHNFDYIPDGISETGAWSYKSDYFDSEVLEKDEEQKVIKQKIKSGTFISADMTKVIRQVEKLTGEKLIYKGTLDVDEDGKVSKHNDDGSTVKDNIIADLIKRIEALENK